MQTTANNSALVIIRQPPYSGSLARAGIDTALAHAAFERPLEVLFMGDGVLQLLPDQAPESLGRKSLARLLASLPLYGIEQVYADAEAATRYRLDLARAPLAVVPLTASAMGDLLRAHDNLLGF
ncbi:MAG: sulfurtransferase complex subunit TusC [Halieaceae bacterium]|nr:sulfurtransferase complex subunit TusC [Halieaceae bacterium]MCP5203241.1 sulfurtransferase complex subunit TusC [Pseudomonadales bacterium]